MARKLPWIFFFNTTSSYFGWYKRCVMPETMNALCLIRFWNLGPISVFCFHILNKSVLGRRKKCGDSPLTYKIILIWQPPRPRLREHNSNYTFYSILVYCIVDSLFWNGIFEQERAFNRLVPVRSFTEYWMSNRWRENRVGNSLFGFSCESLVFWERKSVFPTLRASVCN